MDYIAGLFVGALIGWLLLGRWQKLDRAALLSGPRSRLAALWRRLAGPPSANAVVAASVDAAAAAAVAPAPAAGQSLAERLAALQAVFAPFAHESAHPRDLSEQREFVAAVALLRDDAVPLATVLDYATGISWSLSSVGFAALSQRPDGHDSAERILAAFPNLSAWPMHYALQALRDSDPRPPSAAGLLAIKDNWPDDKIVPGLFRDHFAACEQLGDEASFGAALREATPETHDLIERLLARISHPFAAAALADLKAARGSRIDRDFLNSFGRFWPEPPAVDLLIAADAWTDAAARAQAAMRQSPVRSLLVSGEPGVGKSQFLRLVARRLAADGWTVFEAGGADLMSGQQWFGQLEGRIRKAVEELAIAKRAIWYIPDIMQIALSGTHQGQAASVLDQILPAIAAGRLAIWTEASPGATARVLRLRPALRAALEVIRLEPMTDAETSALAHAFVDRIGAATGLGIDHSAVAVAQSSARQYLSAMSFPGSVLDLLRLTVGRAAKGDLAIDASAVMQTLAQLTGLPVSILDGKERVDLAAIRAYFSDRVIGQGEAVAAIVERIAMLKAGLNDPGKPIGVFLFAGPTGTGKTELAKTLAEFLFGSLERMIRLDMSEFQAADSTWKILGSGDSQGGADSLISRVRKQPFSVVLLDEFEKAHANIWDLFLQVFDDGRLSDTQGQVADFRHCIIILTTNLGATSHRGGGIGFAPAQSGYSSEQIHKAVAQTFRPEFQNRLDKVIVFRPLTRDLMRNILTKELSRVLERRGFKDRDWAVEWQASALEFLLERGFSPEMGARPLKRAIDQYVIAPLAETIVEKRFPQGDQFVFVRSDGRAIQAEFVDPDEDTAAPLIPVAAHPAPVDLSALVIAPAATPAAVALLGAALAHVDQAQASADWDARRTTLSAAIAAADFWSRPDRFDTLAQIALMDRIKAATGTAHALRGRLAKAEQRSGKSSRELVGRLALQLYLIDQGLADLDEVAPIEVAVHIEPTFGRPAERAAALAWCAELAAMYRGWGEKRNMQLSELAGDGLAGPPLLLVSGFGAHRALAHEIGLHVLERPGEDDAPARVAARVRLAIVPLGDTRPERLAGLLAAELARQGPASAIVRRYRREPAPLVRDLIRGWRTGRLDAVLGGDFDLIAAGGS